MRMSQMKLSIAIASMVTIGFAHTLSTQIPGGLPGIGGGGSASGAAAAATSRAQLQVQQRVQAPVQQRLQANVQSRVQKLVYRLRQGGRLP